MSNPLHQARAFAARPRFALTALALFSVAGCASSPGPEGPAIVFDACLPTVLRLAADASPPERAAVEDALSLWQAALGPEIALPQIEGTGDARLTEDSGQQVLPIGFEPAAPAFFGLYRPERGDILINRGLHGPRARAITIAHEIGHAFGLGHVEGRASLMTPGNLHIPPSAEESRLIFSSSGCPR